MVRFHHPRPLKYIVVKVYLTKLQNNIRLRLNFEFGPEIGIFKDFKDGVGLYDVVTIGYVCIDNENMGAMFHRFFETDDRINSIEVDL